MLKGLGDLASLMKNAAQMQGLASELQEQLGRVRVEGTAGGGMVTVEVSGKQRVLSCRIDPSLLEADDRELLEDLVAAAMNSALEKSREAAAEEMNKLAGDLNMPGISELLSRFTGDGGVAG